VNSKTPVIQLKNVSKTFGEVRSLSEVNIEIYPGEIVGLLGDNGAGKSTLVKTIMVSTDQMKVARFGLKAKKLMNGMLQKLENLESKLSTKSEPCASNNQFGAICLWAARSRISLAV